MVVSRAYALPPDESYVPQAGLQLWLKADSLSLNNNDPVGYWPDSSGNANHATQAPGSQPAYVISLAPINKPAVKFSTGQYLSVADTPGLNPSQVTVIAVARRSDGTGTGTGAVMIVEKGTTGGTTDKGYSLRLSNVTTAAGYINGNGTSSGTVINGVTPPPVPVNTFNVIASRYDQTENQLYVNGQKRDSNAYASAITPYTGAMTVGGRGASNTLTGYLAELLVYSRALSDPERRDVEAYLYSKYGVGAMPVAAVPAFDKTGTYGQAQMVGLSCPSMPGAGIRYTLDNSEPGESSALYTAPLLIQATTTIKARAYKPGYGQPASAASAVITIDAHTIDVPRQGMQVWLRADSLALGEGAGVDKWSDQSGNGNDAASMAGAQPTYAAAGQNSKPTVRFATGQYFSIPHSSALQSDQMSAFVVMKRTSGTTAAIVVEKFSSGSNAGYSLQMSNLTLLRHYVGSDSVTATVSGSFLAEALFDQANVSLLANGGTAATVARTAAVPANTLPVYIGGRAGASSLVGEISELMLYNRGLTAAERIDLEAYFKYKYNIAAQAQLQVEKPKFNLQDGVYGAPPEVRISGPDGAQLFYKVGAAADWTPYLGAFTPGGVSSGPLTITAKATKLHYTDSDPVVLNLQIDPATVPVARDGLELWLKADTLASLADLTPVDEWKDQSGKGNHAKKYTDPTRPKFDLDAIGTGKHAVLFTPTDLSHLLVPNVPGLNPQKITIFAISKRASLTSTRDSLVDKGSDTTGYTLRFGSGSATAVATVNSFSITPPAATAAFHTLCSVYDGEKLKLYIDAAKPVEGAYEGVASPNSADLSIGGRGTADTLDGHIAEILLYSRALAADEVRKLEAYAYKKYAVGAMPRAEPPSFDLPDGTIFSGTKSGLGFSATSGAVILYTDKTTAEAPAIADTAYEPQSAAFPNDISTPPAGWTLYIKPTTGLKTPVALSASKTYRAVALVAGHKPSAEAIFNVIRDDTSAQVLAAGPKLWLRADTFHLTDNNTATLWPDSSGRGFHVSQTTATAQPSCMSPALSGKPAVAFNGSTTFLTSVDDRNLDVSTATVFAVAKGTTTADQTILRDVRQSLLREGKSGITFLFDTATLFKHSILSKNPSYNRNLPGGTQTEFRFCGRPAGRAANAFAILSAENRPPFTVEAYSNYDKSALSTVDVYSNAPAEGPLTIGATVAGSNHLNGQIAEILVYDRILSEVERRKVEAYLNNRYAINADARQALPPKITPATGTYAEVPKKVTINSEVGADIYYTQDGQDPFNAGVPRSGVVPQANPFELTPPGSTTLLTLNARAAKLLAGATGQSAAVPYAVSDLTTARIAVEPATASVSRRGLKLWLKADSLPSLATGAAVARWEDQSGSENHATQTNSSLCPTFVASASGLNGKPAVRFTGGTKYLTIPDADSLHLKQVSIVAIAKRGSGTGDAFLLRKGDGTDGYSLMMDNMSTVRSRINTASELGTLAVSEQNKFNVLMATFDQSLNRVYINGTLAANPYAQALEVRDYTADLTVGAATSGSALDGEIAELLVYNHALGEEERRGVLDYAYAKYQVGAVATLTKPRFMQADFNYLEGEVQGASGLTVTLVAGDPAVPGLNIYYTLDGSVPTTASALYSTGLLLNTSKTVKAIAVAPGYVASSVATLKFNCDDPVIPEGNGAPVITYPEGSEERVYQYDQLHQLINDGVKTYNYDAEGNVSRN